MRNRFGASLLAVALLAAGGAAVAAAPAHAATVITTHNGTAGYLATTSNDDQFYMTHATALFGQGNPQYGNDNPTLPVASLSGLSLGEPRTVTGDTSFTVPAAERLGLDAGNGTNDTAQLAVVRTSDNSVAVVAVLGTASTSGGKASISAGTVEELMVAPDKDTLQLDVLSDGRHNFDGYQAGTVTFFAKDVSRTHGPSAVKVNLGTPQPGKEFFRGEFGVVNGPATATSLSSTQPQADGAAGAELRVAHAFLNGNQVGGPEQFGTWQSAAAWSVVAQVGVFGQHTDYGVGPFFSDHATVFAGA